MNIQHEALLDALQHRVQQADLMTPPRRPWVPHERDEIIQVAKECLGIREEHKR